MSPASPALCSPPAPHGFTADEVAGLLAAGMAPAAVIAALATHTSLEHWRCAQPSPDEDPAWRSAPPVEVDGDALVWGTPRYPYPFYALSSPPPLLHVRGNAAAVGLGVGIVGSRNMTKLGEIAATVAALAALDLGAPVVSGLALGVDETAHKVALANKLTTVAVVGCGLAAFDARGEDLARRIEDAGGAVISQHPARTPPTAQSLVARNRLIAALSSPLVVCEAAIRSGSMHTARFAIELDVPVLVPLPRPNHRDLPGAAGLLALAGPPDGIARLGWPGHLSTRLPRRGSIANGFCATRDELIQAISLFWWLRDRDAKQFWSNRSRRPTPDPR